MIRPGRSASTSSATRRPPGTRGTTVSAPLPVRQWRPSCTKT